MSRQCPSLVRPSCGIAGKVGLSDVQHWMWPLFDPCWNDWRAQTLGLAPTLYQSPPDSSTASDHQPHGHQQGQANHSAANNSLVHVPDTLRSGLPQGTFVLPDCVPLLVGVSQSVMGKAIESDASSVKACGFWKAHERPNAVSITLSCVAMRRATGCSELSC